MDVALDTVLCKIFNLIMIGIAGYSETQLLLWLQFSTVVSDVSLFCQLGVLTEFSHEYNSGVV